VSQLFDRRSLLTTFAATGVLTMLDRPAEAARGQSFFKRVGLPIGLQLYTLGDEPSKDLDGTLARVAAMGYRDIELPGLLGKTAAEIRAAMDRAGLKVSSLHIPAAPLGGPGFTLQETPSRIADVMGTLGAKNAVMPIMLWPEGFQPAAGETFQVALTRALGAAGADIWKRTAAILNEKAAALKPLGISLGYHNHNVEFAPIGKTNGWEILARETDPKLITFEVDTGWIAAAGLDPVTFLNKHKGRVRHLHVKDVKATTKANFALAMDPSEIGAGRLDWAKILPAAHKAGVRNFYVEQEPPFAIPRLEAIQRSYTFLAGLKA
jgi:sugar phosphate isomerase/epimerase